MRRLAAFLLLIPAVSLAAAERTWSPLIRGYLPQGESDGAAPTSRGTIAVGPDAKELASPPSLRKDVRAHVDAAKETLRTEAIVACLPLAEDFVARYEAARLRVRRHGIVIVSARGPDRADCY